jgi:hypothetical protein
MSNRHTMSKGVYFMVPQMQNKQPPEQSSRVFLLGIIALMILSALVWILNSEGIVQGTWATIFDIVFRVFSVILGLLQWYTQTCTVPVVPSTLLLVPRYQTTNHKRGWGVELRLSDNKGAIIVCTNRCLCGTAINLTSGCNRDSLRPHVVADVAQRNVSRCQVFVSVFPSLKPGNYTVHVNARQHMTKVTVLAGYAVEIDL